jgi:RNA polymerase sigma-70 factor, ECF subfamily
LRARPEIARRFSRSLFSSSLEQVSCVHEQLTIIWFGSCVAVHAHSQMSPSRDIVMTISIVLGMTPCSTNLLDQFTGRRSTPNGRLEGVRVPHRGAADRRFDLHQPELPAPEGGVGLVPGIGAALTSSDASEPVPLGVSTDIARNAEQRINQVVDQHRRALFAHTLRLTLGDAGWAEDVVQETFMRAWRHWEKMTPEHGSVSGWLKRVAHNLVMDEFRSSRKRRVEIGLTTANEVALPDTTDQILSAHLVRQALTSLPVEHRQALETVYLGDRTAVQAALELDIPVGTLKSRVFYGLRMLRSVMNASGLPEC